MQTANRVIKNTGFLYAKMGITMFISLYTTRLILNALGASDFGLFNVVGGAISMLGFLKATMSGATQRFMSFYEGKGDSEKQKQIFNVSTILHIAIAILLGIVLIIAGFFFFNGIMNIPNDRVFAAKVIYASLTLSVMFTMISVPYEAVLNAHENMLYYSIIGVIESLLKLAAALIIVNFAGDKLVLYGILMAAIPFLIRTIMQIYCRRKYTECIISPRRYWNNDMMKEMINFAGWRFWGSTTGLISNYGQNLIINYYFGTLVNAAQGVANQITGQLMTFSNNMLKALNPVITKKEGEGNRREMLSASFTGSKLSFALLAIFAVPFIIEMPLLLNLWLKNTPEYAIIFCRLLLIRMLVEQLFGTIATSIFAVGEIKAFTISVSVLALLPLVFSALVFHLGYAPWYLYIIYLVSVLIRSFGLFLYYGKKVCGLNIKQFLFDVVFKSIAGVILATVIAISIQYFFKENEMTRLFSVFVLYIPSFMIFYYFVTLNNQERKVINSLISLLRNTLIHK